MNILKILKRNIAAFAIALMAAGITACSESQSYSELLTEEEHAVNWFLSSRTVVNEVPKDSISFQTGEDAPFYKLDEDGYVYMQVISKGNMDNRVKSGDLVYFRFNRMNIKYFYLDGDETWMGNSSNMSGGFTNNTFNYTRFIYENDYLSSTAIWGTGIQMPLKFFGYDCEVNLVLRSYYGFQEDQTTCMPYLINLRYFEPEY